MENYPPVRASKRINPDDIRRQKSCAPGWGAAFSGSALFQECAKLFVIGADVGDQDAEVPVEHTQVGNRRACGRDFRRKLAQLCHVACMKRVVPGVAGVFGLALELLLVHEMGVDVVEQEGQRGACFLAPPPDAAGVEQAVDAGEKLAVFPVQLGPMDKYIGKSTVLNLGITIFDNA